MTAVATPSKPAPGRVSRTRGILRHALTLQVLVLAAPFLFYLVPFVAGYGWSMHSPMTPTFPGMATPPGRQSASPTAVEHYGTGVVVVPFQARLRAYLRDGELPLWNPYSGLGQPFAAQGEGGPYFPMAILRSLLPTSWANAVTFATIAISSVSLYAFLRLLGLSPATAAFGGAAWSLSGVFTPNLARNNYLDQAAMIPPLFAAAAWAISSRRVRAYVIFALVVALHALAGHLQMGVNTFLVLAAFVVFFSYLRVATPRNRLWTIVTVAVFLGIGIALAAPYVLPIAEGIRAAYNKNAPYLAFLTMPSANVVMFFFPLVFGQIFQTWIGGRYPDVADWNNLYAHGSTGLLLLTVLALAALPRDRRDQRLAFFFFLGALIFLHGRYMSFPPVAIFSYLPILSQQSPKHTNGVAVFCLVVAATFGVAWLRQVDWRKASWLLVAVVVGLAGSIATLIGRFGAQVDLNPELAVTHLGITLVISLVTIAAFWLAGRTPSSAQAALIATAAVVGESSVYLLLGTIDLSILAARIGLFVLVVAAGALVAWGRMLPAALVVLAGIAAYGWIVIAPDRGLPKRIEVDAPPRYMQWLKQNAGSEYRAFGIYPDFSSIGEIQNIEVVGPLATNEWVAFVDLVSSGPVARFHRAGSTFSMVNQIEPTIWYDLEKDYPRARPLLDWVGVRYIVLDKTVFNRRARDDNEALLERATGMRVAYDDQAVSIVESPTAQSKAYFTTGVQQATFESTIGRLQASPASIADPVAVEIDLGDATPAPGPATNLPVPMAEYRPNDLRASFEAPGSGIFVVKDSYFPGWQATLNGQPAEVLRANGMVRGIMIPAAGQYEVVMWYRPPSFVNGVWLAAGALVFLAALLVWERRARR